MKALIIKKEHLDKIFDSGKVWEMRSRKTNIRGRIGLIESGSGMIMGEATLSTCGNELTEEQKVSTHQYHKVKNIKALDKWKYPWVLINAQRYDKPKPYKHPQGAVIWVNIKETAEIGGKEI